MPDVCQSQIHSMIRFPVPNSLYDTLLCLRRAGCCSSTSAQLVGCTPILGLPPHDGHRKANSEAFIVQVGCALLLKQKDWRKRPIAYQLHSRNDSQRAYNATGPNVTEECGKFCCTNHIWKGPSFQYLSFMTLHNEFWIWHTLVAYWHEEDSVWAGLWHNP